MPWNDTANQITQFWHYFYWSALLIEVKSYHALKQMSLPFFVNPLIFINNLMKLNRCFSHVTALDPWARYVQVPRLLQLLSVARHADRLSHRQTRPLEEKTEKSEISCQWSRKQRAWIFGPKLWWLQRRVWISVRGWHYGHQWTCQSRNQQQQWWCWSWKQWGHTAPQS